MHKVAAFHCVKKVCLLTVALLFGFLFQTFLSPWRGSIRCLCQALKLSCKTRKREKNAKSMSRIAKQYHEIVRKMHEEEFPSRLIHFMSLFKTRLFITLTHESTRWLHFFHKEVLKEGEQKKRSLALDDFFFFSVLIIVVFSIFVFCCHAAYR